MHFTCSQRRLNTTRLKFFVIFRSSSKHSVRAECRRLVTWTTPSVSERGSHLATFQTEMAVTSLAAWHLAFLCLSNTANKLRYRVAMQPAVHPWNCASKFVAAPTDSISGTSREVFFAASGRQRTAGPADTEGSRDRVECPVADGQYGVVLWLMLGRGASNC
jgi:hypothetical protein